MLCRALRALPGESASHTERLAIVGEGAIARGLATVAAAHGRVLVCTRTPESADRARDALDEGVEVTCTREDLADCTFVVESIVEDHDAKAEVLRELDALLGPDVVLATTTSSLSVEALAAASGRRTASSACTSSTPCRRWSSSS
jgi:3-hydroxybutyryl-CoA dehydrogenase